MDRLHEIKTLNAQLLAELPQYREAAARVPGGLPAPRRGGRPPREPGPPPPRGPPGGGPTNPPLGGGQAGPMGRPRGAHSGTLQKF